MSKCNRQTRISTRGGTKISSTGHFNNSINGHPIKIRILNTKEQLSTTSNFLVDSTNGVISSKIRKFPRQKMLISISIKQEVHWLLSLRAALKMKVMSSISPSIEVSCNPRECYPIHQKCIRCIRDLGDQGMLLGTIFILCLVAIIVMLHQLIKAKQMVVVEEEEQVRGFQLSFIKQSSSKTRRIAQAYQTKIKMTDNEVRYDNRV